MNLVVELLEMLNEAEQAGRVFDLDELVKTFKTDAAISKHAKKLWGTDKLAFKGQPFFTSNGEFTPAFEKMHTAAEKEIGQHLEVDLSMEGEVDQFDLSVDNNQEVYIGYDKDDQSLYFGFDVWANEDDFSEAFEKLYKKVEGVHPEDDEQRSEKAWKKFKNNNHAFFGALVQVKSRDGKRFDAEFVGSEPNGFYSGMKKSHTFRSLGLIDLRLD